MGGRVTLVAGRFTGSMSEEIEAKEGGGVDRGGGGPGRSKEPEREGGPEVELPNEGGGPSRLGALGLPFGSPTMDSTREAASLDVDARRGSADALPGEVPSAETTG
jgi:hypothetical protein